MHSQEFIGHEYARIAGTLRAVQEADAECENYEKHDKVEELSVRGAREHVEAECRNSRRERRRLFEVTQAKQCQKIVRQAASAVASVLNVGGIASVSIPINHGAICPGHRYANPAKSWVVGAHSVWGEESDLLVRQLPDGPGISPILKLSRVDVQCFFFVKIIPNNSTP